MTKPAAAAAEFEPPADSLLLRHLGGDVRRYRDYMHRREVEAIAERAALIRAVCRDALELRQLGPAGGPEPVKVVVEPMLPADQLLIAARQLCQSPAFLDALGDAMLQHEDYFRPLIEHLAKKPRKAKAADVPAIAAATPEQPEAKDTP